MHKILFSNHYTDRIFKSFSNLYCMFCKIRKYLDVIHRTSLDVFCLLKANYTLNIFSLFNKYV